MPAGLTPLMQAESYEDVRWHPAVIPSCKRSLHKTYPDKRITAEVIDKVPLRDYFPPRTRCAGFPENRGAVSMVMNKILRLTDAPITFSLYDFAVDQSKAGIRTGTAGRTGIGPDMRGKCFHVVCRTQLLVKPLLEISIAYISAPGAPPRCMYPKTIFFYGCFSLKR
jgi:hypothetical protein